jgi:hypothetical protein
MTRFIPLLGPRAAGMLALAIVLLTLGAAVLGTAAGAHVAAEAAPGAVPLDEVAPARAKPALHSVIGRVVGMRNDVVVVRPRGGEPVRVHLLPRTIVRRAGEKVDPATIKRGDRVLVVGRMNDDGVLQARGIAVRPRPARPAAEGTAEQPPGADAPADGGD